MTTTQQADPFGHMKRRPLPYVVQCDASIVLEDRPGATGFVPVIVMKLEHTNFDHAEKWIEVRIDRDHALTLATDLLLTIREQLDVEAGAYILGERSNG